MRALPTLVLPLLLVGCTQSLDLKIPDAPLELRVPGGPNDGLCTIAPGSEAYDALVAWVAANQDGWESTYASYVPGLVVSGDDFSINLLEGHAIANLRGKQLERSGVDATLYEHLVCPPNGAG